VCARHRRHGLHRIAHRACAPGCGRECRHRGQLGKQQRGSPAEDARARRRGCDTHDLCQGAKRRIRTRRGETKRLRVLVEHVQELHSAVSLRLALTGSDLVAATAHSRLRRTCVIRRLWRRCLRSTSAWRHRVDATFIHVPHVSRLALTTPARALWLPTRFDAAIHFAGLKAVCEITACGPRF